MGESKHRPNALSHLGAGELSQSQAEGDVLKNRQMWEEGVVLEDHPHVPPVRRNGMHLHAVDRDRAFSEIDETSDHV